MDKSKQYYVVIFAMLLGLVLFAWAYQTVWSWLTYDLRDGLWACSLVATPSPAETADAEMRLVGVEGRFVWAASVLFLLAAIAAIVSVSAYSVLTTLTRWRTTAGAASLLIVVGLLVTQILWAEPNYRAYMQLSSSAESCDFADAGEQAFQFSRYLLLILEPHYQDKSLNIMSLFEQLLPTLVFVCNLFLIVALLTLVLMTVHQTPNTETLAKHFALFRLLLLLGSALFTAIALYYLSQYSWFAQVLDVSNSEGGAQLRGVQRGVTLFIGTSNSLAMILIFLPPGWILSQYSLALCQRETSEIREQARSEWLADRHLTLLSGPSMQIAVVAAPLLVSGAVMLLEKALMGV